MNQSGFCQTQLLEFRSTGFESSVARCARHTGERKSSFSLYKTCMHQIHMFCDLLLHKSLTRWACCMKRADFHTCSYNADTAWWGAQCVKQSSFNSPPVDQVHANNHLDSNRSCSDDFSGMLFRFPHKWSVGVTALAAGNCLECLGDGP